MSATMETTAHRSCSSPRYGLDGGVQRRATSLLAGVNGTATLHLAVSSCGKESEERGEEGGKA